MLERLGRWEHRLECSVIVEPIIHVEVVVVANIESAVKDVRLFTENVIPVGQIERRKVRISLHAARQRWRA